MKNFEIGASRRMLRSHSYRVSRTSDTYSFLEREYHFLPKDLEGNIIVPRDESEVTRSGGFIRFLRERVHRNDQSVVVRASSPEHSFFKSEYSYRMPEDIHHNIIVPVDDYPKGRTR